MNVMSQNLEKIAGGKLETTLKKMTSNPFKSLVLGAGITIAIQSSSAMTVMLVGLVNSGIMELSQTVGVIMGADIGTTLTAWILSLAGIESGNVFVSLLKPENFSPLLALIGVVIKMMCKKEKTKDVGTILVGFSILMYGMEIMKDAVSPLSESPQFEDLLTAFQNPILSLLVGAVFTGVIQSSAASVGILQALALTGTISYRMAIPIVMGLNIGTCVTALISSIGVNKNAKRVGVVHILIKIIGAVVWLTVFCVATTVLDIPQIDDPISPVGIAIVHSIFNIATIILLLPFSNLLVKLATIIVPDAKEKEKKVMLDSRLVSSPPLAVSQCREKAIDMSKIAKDAMEDSLSLIFSYDAKKAASVEKKEQKLDKMDDFLGTYMIQLSSKQLSDNDSNTIFELLHTISDFERIGDHAINVMEIAQKMYEDNTEFSDVAKTDFRTLFAALSEISDMTIKAFATNDVEMAQKVEPLEEVIDKITVKIKDKHIQRLQSGECNPKLGVLLSDLLINCERISDHYSNIAVCIIQISKSSLENHDYLNELRADRTPEFIEQYHKYKEKYRITV
jgi:phosphate:Na+ symporter